VVTVPPAPQANANLEAGEVLDQSTANPNSSYIYQGMPTMPDGSAVAVPDTGTSQLVTSAPPAQLQTAQVVNTVSQFKQACIGLWGQITNLQNNANYFAYQTQNGLTNATGLLNNMSSEISTTYPQLGPNPDPVATVNQNPNDTNLQAITQSYAPGLVMAAQNVTTTQGQMNQCNQVISQLSAQLNDLCSNYDNWQSVASQSNANVPSSDDVLTDIVNERVIPYVLPTQEATANTSMTAQAQDLTDASQMLSQISAACALTVGTTQAAAINNAIASPNLTVAPGITPVTATTTPPVPVATSSTAAVVPGTVVPVAAAPASITSPTTSIVAASTAAEAVNQVLQAGVSAPTGVVLPTTPSTAFLNYISQPAAPFSNFQVPSSLAFCGGLLVLLAFF
jgi:hypothetical protein